jgi:hypothetical protein
MILIISILREFFSIKKRLPTEKHSFNMGYLLVHHQIYWFITKFIGSSPNLLVHHQIYWFITKFIGSSPNFNDASTNIEIKKNKL